MPLRAALFLFLFSLPTSLFAQPDCGVNFTFINVGEGDSIIIEQPKSAPLVIDTGNPAGGFRTIEYLKSREVKALQAVFLTHPHLDHMGGIFAMLENFSAGKLFDNGQEVTQEARTNDMYRWYEIFYRGRPNYSVLRRGATLSFGDVQLEALWPPSGVLNSDWNYNSLVLALKYGQFKALLMGDALDTTEAKLLSEHPDLKAQLLKLGHHGSEYASSEKFLARVQPSAIVVSVDSNNTRGYPDEAKLRDIGISGKLFRTDQDGRITACAQKDGTFSISAEHRRE